MRLRPNPASFAYRVPLRLGAAVLVGGLGAIAVGACGGSSEAPRAPLTVSDAKQDVDAAEARLAGLVGLPGKKTTPGSAPTIDNTAEKAPPAQPKPETTTIQSGEQPTQLSGGDQCETACDALTAMLRAVDRLCALSGEDDGSCKDGRTRANRASQRVMEGLSVVHSVTSVRYVGASCFVLTLGVLAACSESPAAKTAAAPASPAPQAADVAGAAPTPVATAYLPIAPPEEMRTATDAQAAFDGAESRIQRLVGSGVKAQPLSTDGCETACQALASMRRATDRLCDLTSDEPSRCSDARGRLDRATQRVREVCSDCASS